MKLSLIDFTCFKNDGGISVMIDKKTFGFGKMERDIENVVEA